MKISAFLNVMKCLLLLLAAGVTASVSAGTETNATRLAPPLLVKSVFIDDPRSGKDPFFPASTRRQGVTPQPVSPTSPTPEPVNYLSQLALKGISGPKNAPLALINSSTMAVGELAEIRLGRQVVKIRCREIRDRSVIVELDGGGETRELRLREGI